MAKEAFWFKHYANALADEKIQQMVSVYGMEGFGVYWALVGLLYEATDHRLRLHGKYALNGIASHLRMTDVDRLRAFIDDCVSEFGLFRCDDEILSCDGVDKRVQAYNSTLESKRKAGARSAGNRWGKVEKTEPKITPATKTVTDATNSVTGAIGRDDENIQDKNRIDKNRIDKKERGKRLPPPTLAEATAYFREKDCPDPDGEAEKFWNYFESYGWLGSKGRGAPIRNWQLQANTWKANVSRFTNSHASTNKPSAYHERATRNLTAQDIRDTIALDLAGEVPG